MTASASGSKNAFKPWLKKECCIPEVSAEFVAAMEDVLELYAEPHAPQRPVVYFDETSPQLLSEARLRSVPNEATLCPELQALERERNAVRATIHWRFNTQDKLHRLYPANHRLTEY